MEMPESALKKPKKPLNGWIWVLLATLVLIVLGLILLGIPGALFMEIARILFRIDPESCVSDGAWPAALMTAFVAPFGLPLSYLIARLALPAARTARRIVAVIIWLIFSIGVAALVYISAQNDAARSATRPDCTRYHLP